MSKVTANDIDYVLQYWAPKKPYNNERDNHVTDKLKDLQEYLATREQALKDIEDAGDELDATLEADDNPVEDVDDLPDYDEGEAP